MMGPKQEAQGALFYEFSLEDHVPGDHLLRSIDRFVDFAGNQAAPHPADPIKCPMSTQRTQAPESVDNAQN
jgi:hypothetical protein